MKNLRKIMVVGFFAAVTLLSSCVKNEIAPEVTALRDAQLEMVQAKTAYQVLMNERQVIANNLALSNATYDAAINDINLQSATADLTVTLAEVDAALLIAQADVEEAKLDLQAAVNELELFLNTAGLEQAAEYLHMYQNAMDDYFDRYKKIFDQDAKVSTLEAAFAQDDYALVAEIFQRELDLLTHELSVYEDVLTSMEAVAADPTSLETELAAAAAMIQDLMNENALLIAAKAKDEVETVAPAWDAWKTAVGGESYFEQQDFDGVVPTYLDAMDKVKLFNEDITDLNYDLVGYAEVGVRKASELVTAEASLASATTNYTAKKVLSDAILADLLTARANKDAAWIALQVAISDNDVDANALDAAESKLSDAEDAVDDAQDAVDDAEDDLDDAQDDENAAEIALQQAEDDKVADEPALQADVDAADADVVLAEAALTAAEAAYDADPTVANLQAVHDAETDLEIAEGDLADAEDALAQLDDDIDAAQADLTDAVNDKTDASLALSSAQTDLANAEAAETAAQVDVDAELANMVIADATLQTFTDAYSAADDAKNEVKATFEDAEDVTDDAEDLMDDMQDDVDGLTERIADNNEDIADANHEIAIAQEKIAYLTGIMADLQTEYDAVDLAALEAAYQIAIRANNDLQDAIDATEDGMDAQEFLIEALQEELASLDEGIKELQEMIDGMKEGINDLERDLADNVIDEAELTVRIEEAHAKLDMFVSQRDAYLELADQYWALYEAASESGS
jgi:predicted  nucleic acid-binding Zn-ribbon protein